MNENLFNEIEKVPEHFIWNKNYYLIGLTGTLASGKSTVANIFKKYGCKVIHADEVAKKMYFNDIIKKKIIDKFGQESYLDDRTLNVKFLSTEIFSKKENVEWINQLIHPMVKNELKNELKKAKMGEIIVYDVPLLFESNSHLQQDYDLIIVVDAPVEMRVNRAIIRNNWTKEEFLKRETNQLSSEHKRALSQCIIWNNNSFDILEKKIDFLIKNIEKSKPKNLL